MIKDILVPKSKYQINNIVHQYLDNNTINLQKLFDNFEIRENSKKRYLQIVDLLHCEIDDIIIIQNNNKFLFNPLFNKCLKTTNIINGDIVKLKRLTIYEFCLLNKSLKIGFLKHIPNRTYSHYSSNYNYDIIINKNNISSFLF